jgi:signal transduction histidine kinase
MMRSRRLVPLLILLIVAPFLVYAWVAIDAARDIARREAFTRNFAAAQLGARLVGEQNGDAVDYLRSVARHHGLRRALQSQDRVSLRRQLEEARQLNEDFASLAVYVPDGPLLAISPRSAAQALPADASSANYLRHASDGFVAESGASRGGDPQRGLVVHLAVPVTQHKDVMGVLVAAVRLRVIRDWLEPINIGLGGVIYVVDSNGMVVANSRSKPGAGGNFSSFEAVRRVLRGEEGRQEMQVTVAGAPALVGYEPVRGIGWGVVAVQPTRDAYARADQLARHLALLLVPVAGIALGIGMLLRALFDRQAELAHKNAELSVHLREQNERLRQADRLKSDFLANVSHDLRTPLATIKASISGVLEPDIDWDRESLRGFLGIVNEEADRLTRRVRNLLDMTRLEAGALPVEKDLCDLTDVVGAALERLSPLLRGRPVEDQFPAEPLYVNADYAQLEMVIVNVVENALKYSPPGTPLLIAGGTADGFAEIAVRDQGPGVPPGDEERVFQKFYRAPAGRQTAGGTGLGLAICQTIVEAHGGQIGVRRPSGGGAEFWFRIPLAPLEEEG